MTQGFLEKKTPQNNRSIMKRCKTHRQNLLLYVYQELDEIAKAETEAHLQICHDCRAELAELQQLQAVVPDQPMLEPSKEELKILRNAFSLKMRARLAKSSRPKRRLSALLRPSPAWQIGFALLFLALGFVLGRRTVSPTTVTSKETNLQALLAASREIQIANSAIDPYLAGVEKLKYDPATGQVEIYYNTINDVRLRGDVADPAVRQVLRHAMLEESSPAVRLHAIKTVNAVAVRQQTLDPELVDAVEQLLEKEQNQGVRLMALKVLKALPMSATIKNILVRILLYDSNPALRIEAFEALTGQQVNEDDRGHYLEAAREDSSTYIRYRANQLIEKLESKKKEQSHTSEIEREQ